MSDGWIEPRTRVSELDPTLLGRLEDARDYRHRAVRYMQGLNDKASLHEIEATRLRSQATLMVRELNEDVPEPFDR